MQQLTEARDDYFRAASVIDRHMAEAMRTGHVNPAQLALDYQQHDQARARMLRAHVEGCDPETAAERADAYDHGMLP